MSNVSVRVDHISKRYRIGTKEETPDTFVGAISYFAKRPISNLRRLRRLTTFSGHLDENESEVLWALKDVSFELQKGEVLGVVGSNGAGKSTLLKILSRITYPTLGRVELLGRVSSLLEVGTGFHPELTGRENIYLNGTILGMTKNEIDRKFDEIVNFSGVEKFIDTPVKFFSSGMGMRLAFSVAAHLEPEVLLVDEVLAVGDATFQKKCIGKMGEVASEGRTVLFVSHNMSSVQELCTRAICIENGEVQLDSHDVQSVVKAYLESAHQLDNGQHNFQTAARPKAKKQDIYLHRCTVLNAKDEPANELMYGEPFSIVIEAKTNVTLDDLSIVIGLDTLNRNRITTVLSDDVGQNYRIEPESPLKIKANFDHLVLNPGEYLITLAVRKGRISLDTLMYAVRFRVTEVAFSERSHFNNTWGMLSVKTSWEELA